MFLISHSVFYQWDKWIQPQLTHPGSAPRKAHLSLTIQSLLFPMEKPWKYHLPLNCCFFFFFCWELTLIHPCIFLALPSAFLTWGIWLYMSFSSNSVFKQLPGEVFSPNLWIQCSRHFNIKSSERSPLNHFSFERRVFNCFRGS